MKKEKVSPVTYTKEYYLSDAEGYREFNAGLNKHIHEKFKRILEWAKPKREDICLDFGCGRGDFSYYLLQKNVSLVVSVDYSRAAIDITKSLLSSYNSNTAMVLQDDIELHNIPKNILFSKIFLLDVVEHLYDWQLKVLFMNLSRFLKHDGTIYIYTPNTLYENYLYPIKRVASWPFILTKYTSRLLQKKITLKEWKFQVTKIKLPSRDNYDHVHVNVMSPMKLKKLLKNFNTKVFCRDHSRNPIGIMLKKWAGRELCAEAHLK